ncbi:MAG TPA: hypothetical protein EYG11_20735 [Candidatus Latescibacteria bacterium]|nr:hypothetical protein [Candidatus Handelsmanbacteria bacterium]HIL11131.1 hypothetical protein [Candidatus Latescibacterota bacterium]
MEAFDYNRCFAINTAACDGAEKNTCRTQLLARCEIETAATGQAEEFFLGKECIGEYMYMEGGIAQVPTSEVCTIFSRKESSLLKRFANHENDVVQTGPIDIRRKGFDGSYSYWTDLRFSLKQTTARHLSNVAQIIDATLAGEVLLGRTTLTDTESGQRALLEYPIHYMNVHPPEKRFQVDVGPILYPDLTATTGSAVEHLQLAYVIFNQLHEVEFALRVPTQVVAEQRAEVLHYSQVIRVKAASELFSLS